MITSSVRDIERRVLHELSIRGMKHCQEAHCGAVCELQPQEKQQWCVQPQQHSQSTQYD